MKGSVDHHHKNSMFSYRFANFCYTYLHVESCITPSTRSFQKWNRCLAESVLLALNLASRNVAHYLIFESYIEGSTRHV